MSKLENVSVEALEAALARADTKTETQRLMVAILYKRGPSVPMIAEWLDMRERTIYDWFDRLEQRPIEEAITHDDRPGRPSKLRESEREEFETAVSKPPSEIGYDQPAWTTKLAKQYLEDEFGVEYTMRHVTRLLHEAGLSYQHPREQQSTSAGEDREIFWNYVEKSN